MNNGAGPRTLGAARLHALEPLVSYVFLSFVSYVSLSICMSLLRWVVSGFSLRIPTALGDYGMCTTVAGVRACAMRPYRRCLLPKNLVLSGRAYPPVETNHSRCRSVRCEPQDAGILAKILERDPFVSRFQREPARPQGGFFPGGFFKDPRRWFRRGSCSCRD